MSFNQAAEDLKSFANRLKPLVQLGEFLEKVGSIEQAAGEAEARKFKAVQAAEEASKELENLQLEISSAKEEIEAAEQKKASIIESAFERQGAIMTDAKVEADKIYLDAVKKKKEIEAQRSELQKDCADLDVMIEDKKSELAGVQAQLDSIKQKLASFMK